MPKWGKQLAPKWYILHGKRGRRYGVCMITKIAEVSHKHGVSMKRKTDGQDKQKSEVSHDNSDC